MVGQEGGNIATRQSRQIWNLQRLISIAVILLKQLNFPGNILFRTLCPSCQQGLRWWVQLNSCSSAMLQTHLESRPYIENPLSIGRFSAFITYRARRSFFNKEFKDYSSTFRDIFSIFQGLHSVQKKSLESMSFLILPQHEEYYPEGLAVFSGLDKVSTKIQGFSSTDCNLQGLSRPLIFILINIQGLSRCMQTL